MRNKKSSAAMAFDFPEALSPWNVAIASAASAPPESEITVRSRNDRKFSIVSSAMRSDGLSDGEAFCSLTRASLDAATRFRLWASGFRRPVTGLSGTVGAPSH